MFWTYAAAHAPSEEIRQAAERLAREELGHVATLRRERRRAFHEMRHAEAGSVREDLPTLEGRLSELLIRILRLHSEILRSGCAAWRTRRRSARPL